MTRGANDPQASQLEEFGQERTREQQVPIIDGLVNDNKGQFQVNVPNNGALAGVPDDVVVGVPAIVNKMGVQSVRVGPLSDKIILEQIRPEWPYMERELLAYLEGVRLTLFLGALEIAKDMNAYYQDGPGNSLIRKRLNLNSANGSRAS